MKKLLGNSAKRFTINEQIGWSQVKTIVDEEIFKERNKDSPSTYNNIIDPIDLVRFSIRRS